VTLPVLVRVLTGVAVRADDVVPDLEEVDVFVVDIDDDTVLEEVVDAVHTNVRRGVSVHIGERVDSPVDNGDFESVDVFVDVLDDVADKVGRI
jgi:hypothetical protein